MPGIPEPLYVLSEAGTAFTAVEFLDNSTFVAGTSTGQVLVLDLQSWLVKRRVFECEADESHAVLGLGRAKDAIWAFKRARGLFFTALDDSGEDGRCPQHQIESDHIGFCSAVVCDSGSSIYAIVPMGSMPCTLQLFDISESIKQLSATTEIPREQLRTDLTATHQFALAKTHGMLLHLRQIAGTADQNDITLLAACESGSVLMIRADPQTGFSVVCEHSLCKEPLLGFDAVGRVGLAGTAESKLMFFTWTDGFKANTVEFNRGDGICAVSLRKDAKLSATGSSSGLVHIHSTRGKHTLLASLQLHSASIGAITWSQDGHTAVAGRDGRISFWKLY